ncbi:MAG: universal stress protein [Bacteroidetes bacterium]|nr:universal stress protein [Bacteroidota bacterium]
MKRILCPVDFSETAYKAAGTAAKLAQKCEAQLNLLNVQSNFETTPAELMWGKKRKVEAVANQLEELSSEISLAYKISCYGNVQSSDLPLSKIISVVGSDYDLVVMGTNGSDQVYDFLFGTNSYRVAKESSVPVLLLPPDYEFEDFSNIVFAADYFHEVTTPPEQLIKWAGLLSARITFLQIMTTEYRHQQEQKLIHIQLSMKQFLADLYHDFKTIYADQPIEGIMDYIKENDCDVLALNFRHHSMIEKLFHKNVLKNLCAITPCPLFLFHL